MADVSVLPLSSIEVDPEVQIRNRTSEERIEYYREVFDLLPQIVVFDVGKDKYLLSDGFQRVAAAETSDPPRTEIRAEIRQGTWWDAFEYAAVANTTHGQSLDPKERRKAVLRVKRCHSDWTERQIGKRLFMSNAFVHEVIAVDRLLSTIAWAPAWRLAPTVLAQVAQAHEEHWLPLCKATDRRRWTGAQVHAAVRLLDDDATPDETKQALLRGEIDPGDVPRPAPAPRAPRPTVHHEEPEDDEPDEGDYVEPTGDPVGPDVGERHRTTKVRISIQVPRPPKNTRQRGARQYDREWRWVMRGPYELAVDARAIEGGLGDLSVPREERVGAAHLRTEIDRQLGKILAAEGWPDAMSSWEEEAG